MRLYQVDDITVINLDLIIGISLNCKDRNILIFRSVDEEYNYEKIFETREEALFELGRLTNMFHYTLHT